MRTPALRRIERELAAEYRAVIDEMVTTLEPDSFEQALRIAGLPDLVRGYEDVKLASVERYREELESALRRP